MGLDFIFDILSFSNLKNFMKPRKFLENFRAIIIFWQLIFERSIYSGNTFKSFLIEKRNPKKIIFVLSIADYTSTKSQQIEQLGESRFPIVEKSQKSRSQEDF